MQIKEKSVLIISPGCCGTKSVTNSVRAVGINAELTHSHDIKNFDIFFKKRFAAVVCLEKKKFTVDWIFSYAYKHCLINAYGSVRIVCEEYFTQARNIPVPCQYLHPIKIQECFEKIFAYQRFKKSNLNYETWYIDKLKEVTAFRQTIKITPEFLPKSKKPSEIFLNYKTVSKTWLFYLKKHIPPDLKDDIIIHENHFTLKAYGPTQG